MGMRWKHWHPRATVIGLVAALLAVGSGGCAATGESVQGGGTPAALQRTVATQQAQITGQQTQVADLQGKVAALQANVAQLGAGSGPSARPTPPVIPTVIAAVLGLPVNGLTKGSPDAKVTLTEYSDFQ